MIARALPCLQILISIAAAVAYAAASDWRRAIYWAAAAVITAAVTF